MATATPLTRRQAGLIGAGGALAPLSLPLDLGLQGICHNSPDREFVRIPLDKSPSKSFLNSS